MQLGFKFFYKEVSGGLVNAYCVVMIHPVMGIIRNHQGFHGYFSFGKPVDQVNTLVEAHVSVIIGMNDHYGGSPFTQIGYWGR
jgi:hypothetical protein